MSRDGAIARARAHYDGGDFVADLRRRVAFPSTSQEPEHAPVLRRYLQEEMAPSLARLARMRQRFRSAAEMSQMLVIRGLDEDMLRSHATEDVRLSIYLDERFSAASQPTEQELREVGEANRQSFVDERRRALIAAWTAELRRRTEVTVVERGK